MIIDPVTIVLPRHELEALLVAARQKRAGIRYATSPGARQLDRVIDRVDQQVVAHDDAKVRAPLFQKFWSENQSLDYKAAKDSFALIEAERGLTYFVNAYSGVDL